MSVEQAAERLWNAGQRMTPCDPVRGILPGQDDRVAYSVQQQNVDRRVSEYGWHVSGRKIGLTSDAVQRQLGVDRPDFGTLFTELGHPDGAIIPSGVLLQPRVEAEVAFILGSDLTAAEHTVAEVAAAVDHIVAALEVTDSRIANWDISFLDTVADNASFGRYVLGQQRHRLDDVDLPGIEMTLTVNGEPRSAGRGADCLGSPLFAALWLADTMNALGTPLRRGDIVLTGALGAMVPVRPGDHVHAALSGLGTVSTRFAPESKP